MTPPRELPLRQSIVAAARELSALGLSPLRSGNVSVRYKGGILITASGIPPSEMDAAVDVIFVDERGSWAHGAKGPSSEWRFHKSIYEMRPDAGAVVHCHSRFATALACAHLPIPAFHYMVAKAGGAEIPLAPYATYGTAALAQHVAAALGAVDACLLANHGQIAIGRALESALELAQEVEALAAQYVAARSIATPVLLSPDEMLRVAEKLKAYGNAAIPAPRRRPRSRAGPQGSR
jgi:L-fuculose-phosphate aldolase